MTGDAPQPGETPRNDSNLWSYREPDAAWWRPENERATADELATAAPANQRPRRRRVPIPVERPLPADPSDPPAPGAAERGATGAAKTGATGPGTDSADRAETEPPFAVEALDAHAAGVHDAADALAAPTAATKTKTTAGTSPTTGTADAGSTTGGAGRRQTTGTAGRRSAAGGAAQKPSTGATGQPDRAPGTTGPKQATTATESKHAAEAAPATGLVGGAAGGPITDPANDPAGGPVAASATQPVAASVAQPVAQPVAPTVAPTGGAAGGEPVERDHDAPTEERFLPFAGAAAGEEPPASAVAVPEEVMVLPEPGRDRPTVVFDRGAVPGQSRTQLSPAAERARERMENSPFWMTDEERAAASETRARVAAPGEELRGKPPRRKPRMPRRPAPGLLGLVALGLIAAFFSWVSAEPFWLAVGHGDPGLATVGQCSGAGITQRCSGSFAADEGAYTVQRVALLGVEASQRTPGAVVPGRMVSADSRQVYLGAPGPLIHLRWVLGFVLVLLCGYGVAGLTGARLLETPRARRGAVLMSLAGPILLLIGFLVAAY